MATVVNNSDGNNTSSMAVAMMLGGLLLLGVLGYFMFANGNRGASPSPDGASDTTENTTVIEAPDVPDVTNEAPEAPTQEVNVPDEINVDINTPAPEGE